MPLKSQQSVPEFAALEGAWFSHVTRWQWRMFRFIVFRGQTCSVLLKEGEFYGRKVERYRFWTSADQVLGSSPRIRRRVSRTAI